MSDHKHMHQGEGMPLEAVDEMLSRLDDEEFADRFGRLALVMASGEIVPTDGKPGTQDIPTGPEDAGPVSYRVFPVRKGSSNQMRHIYVGRTRNNDVWIDDATLSKVHAFLLADDAQVRIYDAGSANGTFVNGQVVPVRGDGDPTPLESRDSIRLGGLEATLININDLRTFVDGLLRMAK